MIRSGYLRRLVGDYQELERKPLARDWRQPCLQHGKHMFHQLTITPPPHASHAQDLDCKFLGHNAVGINPRCASSWHWSESGKDDVWEIECFHAAWKMTDYSLSRHNARLWKRLRRFFVEVQAVPPAPPPIHKFSPEQWRGAMRTAASSSNITSTVHITYQLIGRRVFLHRGGGGYLDCTWQTMLPCWGRGCSCPKRMSESCFLFFLRMQS